MSTRERLMSEALRLFGERGYAATSVSQIEAAAGLRAGSGGLYTHFRSKEELLRAGLDWLLGSGAQPDANDAADRPGGGAQAVTREAGNTRDELLGELEMWARAGLGRLHHDRDYNRILLRDLRAFPDLLERSAERELRPRHDQLETYLADPRFQLPAGVSARALAAVLIGATSHWWVLTDIFGTHPAGVSEQEYFQALTQLAANLLMLKEKL